MNYLQTYATNNLPGPVHAAFRGHFGSGWMNSLIQKVRPPEGLSCLTRSLSLLGLSIISD